MNARVVLTGLAALLVANQSPPTPPPTAAEVELILNFGASYRPHAQEPIDSWERDLRSALSRESPDEAADRLAPRYGISSADMRTLIRLWIAARVRLASRSEIRAEAGDLRRALLALLDSTGRAPLVLLATADLLNRMSACSEEDFDAMMRGSTDPAADAWRIAEATVCRSDRYLEAVAEAPRQAMPALIRLAQYAAPQDAIPLYEWLTSPVALERVAEPGRPVLLVSLFEEHLRLLFRAGLTARAVALVEGLPADMRRRVLAGEPRNFTAIVDGLPVAVRQGEPDESLRLDLAMAYALAGRSDEASALLSTMRGLAAARRRFACMRDSSERRRARCEDDARPNWPDILLLDHFLRRPAADPYLLAEAGFSDSSPQASGPAAELRCRLFPRDRFPEICRDAWSSVLAGPEIWLGRDRIAQVSAALDQRALPGFAEARQAVAPELRRLAEEQSAGTPARVDPHAPVTAGPEAVPFPALPLPSGLQGRPDGGAQWPSDVASLPERFFPVRFERDGDRAVAISLSQIYDPTASVSNGAYWAHLSDDGGRTWHRPLYTGIVHRFPYVVPQSSLLPMIDGGRLNLEVQVDEVDTSAATDGLHPVPLPSRRRTEGLYIQLSLAELSLDSDGDGFSDLAERRLLMDRPSTVGGTPHLGGSDPGGSCRRASRRTLPMAAVLEEMRAAQEREAREAGGPRSVEVIEWPTFIVGNPADFRCLRSGQPVIVYNERDIAELKRFRPHFLALTMSPIVYNRARDRAYVTWADHLSSGTYRLRLISGSWRAESISNESY